MIRFENLDIVGWEPAIRGMRNPMNSWAKSDSTFDFEDVVTIGPNDLELSMKLVKGGACHAKFRRMIVVYVDITAPLYWWKEFDTYKVGTVANSCSTMHKIHAKPFEESDFSTEHLMAFNEEWTTDSSEYPILEMGYDGYLSPMGLMNTVIRGLNIYRKLYLTTKDKKYWWQMIQLLPSSYNQKRTVELNYEVLANIYKYRKEHKLDEWREFCSWIETLPQSEWITS